MSNRYKYEYERNQILKDNESKYIGIPLSIIINDELDSKRVATLSYLRMHCGLNDVVNFTIPDMVEWCGGKPDRSTNGINNKFLEIINIIGSLGYLTFLNQQSRSSFMKCKLDTEYYNQECLNGYSVVYLDEIEKIMNYKKENSKDTTLANTTILLVFAYFRHKINRRPNELNPEERSPEMIADRKKRLPEAYNGNINDIAKELGIHKQTLSKIIDILEIDLKLLVTDRAYRVKNEDGEFRTLPTIFANAYKRENNYLLISGEDYSRNEIEQKAKNMKQYYQNYKIDKNKRK